MHRLVESARAALSLRTGNPLAPATVALAVLLVALPVVVAPVLLIAGADPGGVAFVVVLVWAIALTVLAVLVVASRAETQQFARLMEGDVWARWPIAPAERRRYAQDERGRLWRTEAQALAVLALGVVLFAVLAGMIGEGKHGWLAHGAGGVIIALTVAWIAYTARSTVRRAAAPDTDTITIGPPGIYQIGRFRRFSGPGRRLIGADIVPGIPARLRFTVEEHSAKLGWGRAEVHVPVPTGREAEAASLVERIQRAVGQSNRA